jgi:hypothetical protein
MSPLFGSVGYPWVACQLYECRNPTRLSAASVACQLAGMFGSSCPVGIAKDGCTDTPSASPSTNFNGICTFHLASCSVPAMMAAARRASASGTTSIKTIWPTIGRNGSAYDLVPLDHGVMTLGALQIARLIRSDSVFLASASTCLIWSTVLPTSWWTERASSLALSERDSAFDDEASALSAKVFATDAAAAAEFAECCVSTSTLSSRTRTLVSASLTKYSATPSPATPSATSIQPMSPAFATHFRWRSFLVTSSGQTRSQPFKSSFLTRMYQNVLTRAIALRPRPTACQTSGASQTMPTATTMVEMTRNQNQKFDHASKPPRMALSSASADSGLGGVIGSHKDVDRTEFFLTFLEVFGVTYVIVSVLCIWEFTIGIKESIKNLFCG